MIGAFGWSVFKRTNSSILVGLIQVQLLPLNFTVLLYSSVNYLENEEKFKNVIVLIQQKLSCYFNKK